jgi:hypothetical protein
MLTFLISLLVRLADVGKTDSWQAASKNDTGKVYKSTNPRNRNQRQPNDEKVNIDGLLYNNITIWCKWPQKGCFFSSRRTTHEK